LIDAIKIFNIKSEEIFLKIFFENLPQSQCALENLSNYEIYNLYKNLETVDLALQYAIYNEKSAKFYFEKLKNIKPEITGADLMAQGFEQGKPEITGADIMEQGFEQGRIIGEILNSILKEKLNDPSKFKKKQDEIDFVIKNFS